MTDQLFLMLLHLAATYPGNEAKFNEYVPEHLLEAAAGGPSVPGAGTAEMTGGAGAITGTAHATGALTVTWESRAGGSSDPFTSLGSSAPDEEVVFDALPAGVYDVRVHGVNDEGNGPDSEVMTVTVT